MPARATYDPADSAYHPEASREYEEIDAESWPRCGRASAMPNPIAAMTSSTWPYARTSVSGRDA